MKYLSIAAVAAVLSICSFSQASAQTVLYYPNLANPYSSLTTDATLEYSTPFTETFFSPSFLNSTFSAALTALVPKSAASGTVTADVYLVNTLTSAKVEVANEALSLALSTPSTKSGSTSTADYPTTFYMGPTGTFNELVVDVTGSSLTNALISFNGLAELEDVPEPSTWAMLLGGVGVLLVAVRFRRVARQP